MKYTPPLIYNSTEVFGCLFETVDKLYGERCAHAVWKKAGYAQGRLQGYNCHWHLQLGIHSAVITALLVAHVQLRRIQTPQEIEVLPSW